MYVDTFQDAAISYLRRITEWWSTWWPWHRERDDRIEALTTEFAELREDVAALRGTQNVLVMSNENSLSKLKITKAVKRIQTYNCGVV